MPYSKTHRGGDADRAGELVLPIAHLLGCKLEILDDFLATLKEIFTAVGEGLLPRRPAQQPDIQGCLQCAEALTDDRLGDAKTPAGFPHASCLDDCDKRRDDIDTKIGGLHAAPCAFLANCTSLCFTPTPAPLVGAKVH